MDGMSIDGLTHGSRKLKVKPFVAPAKKHSDWGNVAKRFPVRALTLCSAVCATVSAQPGQQYRTQDKIGHRAVQEKTGQSIVLQQKACKAKQRSAERVASDTYIHMCATNRAWRATRTTMTATTTTVAAVVVVTRVVTALARCSVLEWQMGQQRGQRDRQDSSLTLSPHQRGTEDRSSNEIPTDGWTV